ncbi:MAG: hypothetical protein COU85_01195 [Candidatus Portnoybacteria bacterium CG10_big_fil_rev_8_21_14_0_10_44_7]|uniref:Sugar 3,4-ketoisomerase QdtA cupin domain-containing protein n=1 Tax=Candidatus Portnoybacteria bacterium CG10_big_fil_rev_8_21_14_0_10_44_7 TaxID=1974816 RepID=A0A2M8KJ23_9BACT|nr:MAG: hypothetical protein COU85_01195 [Candidatus Portnoybacteria bacterium CG10_big_fil_rev_8_21_14_0_10_44_7]
MELKFKELQIKKIDTPAFTMSPVELKEYIDFSVKRIYFVSQPRGERKTGAHCHKQEEEMFILAQGSATAVIDRGRGPEEFKMVAPQSALLVGAYVWHHFKEMSKDAILLALSSTNYNPDRSDYIEDYREYLKL